MTDWKIASRYDFGAIRLGMTKADVNANVGNDVFFRRVSRYPGLSADHYGRKQVIVTYDEDLRTICIEVTYPHKVSYLGVDLLREPVAAIRTLFEGKGLRLEEDGRGLLCNTEGILLNLSQNNDNRVFSVCLFEEGHWQRLEAKRREYATELSRQAEAWRTGSAKN
jgi:hypothetical protein